MFSVVYVSGRVLWVLFSIVFSVRLFSVSCWDCCIFLVEMVWLFWLVLVVMFLGLSRLGVSSRVFVMVVLLSDCCLFFCVVVMVGNSVVSRVVGLLIVFWGVRLLFC